MQARIGLKRIVFASMALFMITFPIGLPLQAFADDADSTCSPVTASSGTQRPTGSDANTYTYSTCTGLWENQYYTWNPDTKETRPLTPYVYTYNSSTGKWDANKWTYGAASGTWHQTTFSVSEPPAGSQTIGGPEPVSDTASQPAAQAGTDNTQPSSTQSSTSQNDATLSSGTNAGLNNNLISSAISGNVMQLSNTTTGNAMSGNAQAIANVMNLLQSSSSLSANVATFVADIDGDVQGDFIIDPNMLQPALADNSLNGTNNIDVTIANNGEIINNIALTAGSGDVTASKNTTAGDATSGNAQAVANVVNMMNSMIVANQSFLGIININGNFNGNVLMPEKFLDTLLATNAPHETVSVSSNTINNVAVDVSNNQAIKNNITTAAASGAVTMEKNTTAGSAQSGSATTNVTIFDLTGSQVTASNSMLVFVNVLGSWVGLIMDAPAGSTAAALGGGVKNASINDTAHTAITNTGNITNNLDIAAKTGDVSATKNTTVGNARSGDAEAAVNIANITNSSFSLANWFGVLFINVFGNWSGNFGVLKTQTGDVANGAAQGPQSQSHGSGNVFGFTAPSIRTAVQSKPSAPTVTQDDGASVVKAVALAASPAAAVLGSAEGIGSQVAPGSNSTQAKVNDGNVQLVLIGGGLFAAGVLYNGVDYLRRRQR